MSIADAINGALRASGWQNALRQPLAGDASRRRYERLIQGEKSAILMISPPSVDPSLPQFLHLTACLRDAHLSAPDVYYADQATGIAILEDIGPILTQHPAFPGEKQALSVALSTICAYADLSPDVPTSSPNQMIDALTVTADNYPGLDPDAFDAFRSELRQHLTALDGTKALSLRDLHAGNLTWLPDRSGPARIGLLDYQDAFLTHPLYDLVSLLCDARVPYPVDMVADLKTAFFERLSMARSEFDLAFDILTLQRNTRILGIFSKLAHQDGKHAYLRFVPHTRETLDRALRHPDLGDLRQAFQTACPPLTPTGVA